MRGRTLDENAQVWAREGGVGVIDDDDFAVGVEQEQGRLREGLVCLARVAWLAHEQAPPACMCRHMPSANQRGVLDLQCGPVYTVVQRQKMRHGLPNREQSVRMVQ